MKPRNNNEKKNGYKEPKVWWYIDIHLVVKRGEIYLSNYDKILKEIGNYFETRQEAEQAVKKLKAIKKLKDYDLHIEWANTPEYDEDYDEWRCSVDFSVREGCDGDKLFDLLFGGKE